MIKTPDSVRLRLGSSCLRVSGKNLIFKSVPFSVYLHRTVWHKGWVKGHFPWILHIMDQYFIQLQFPLITTGFYAFATEQFGQLIHAHELFSNCNVQELRIQKRNHLHWINSAKPIIWSRKRCTCPTQRCKKRRPKKCLIRQFTAGFSRWTQTVFVLFGFNFAQSGFACHFDDRS